MPNPDTAFPENQVTPEPELEKRSNDNRVSPTRPRKLETTARAAVRVCRSAARATSRWRTATP